MHTLVHTGQKHGMVRSFIMVLHTGVDWMQHFPLRISVWCHESSNLKKKLLCHASICSVWCSLVCICPNFHQKRTFFSWLVDSLALLIIDVSLYIRCYFLRLYSHLLLWCYGPYSFPLAFLMTHTHSVWSWACLLHPLIPIILRSTCMSSSHVNFGLPTFLLPSSLASKAALGILLFPFLLNDPAIQVF